MKVLFVGSKYMGVLILEELLRKNVDVTGVVARWDDPTPNQWYPSVSDFAYKNNLRVYKPKNINDPKFIGEISEVTPDMIFTVFYPKIYSKFLLEAVSWEAFNLHFGPLPMYRGCFPGAWAIINGETSHGVTIHRMDGGADSGEIVSKVMVPIDGDETGISLYKKCEQAGLQLFSSTWPQFDSGEMKLIPQDPEKVTYYKRGIPLDGVIDFTWTANRIDRFVRALTFPPFRNPATFQNGRRLVVEKCEILDGASIRGKPGEILDFQNGIVVQAGKGIVKITECRDHAGKQVSLDEVIKSYNFQAGEFLLD